MQNIKLITFKNLLLLIVFLIIGLGVGITFKHFKDSQGSSANNEDLKVIPNKEIIKVGSDLEVKKDCFEIQDGLLKDDCFINSAIENKDESLCDKIIDQNYRERCKTFPSFINN